MKSELTKNQTREWSKLYHQDGAEFKIKVIARYDDRCNNGHNTFSLTADIREKKANGLWVWTSGGCCHEEITKRFPELASLIKWHLCSSDGPMYYIANTVYSAGDRDCNGLRKNERRQIKNGKTGELYWVLESSQELPRYKDAYSQPTETAVLTYKPWYRIGEGKARELDAARHSAIWPEASESDLIAPGLEERLKARLPALMQEFKNAMEGLGFTF